MKDNKSMAEKAVADFERTGVVPQMGQRIMEGFGPGSVHLFPDGSVATHWADGAFTLAEIEG